VIYCLDALHGERRDRSVLFWKSLPVSDLTTVLAKASIPLVVLPLLTFAITVVTQIIMLLVGTARLMGTGLSLWSHLPLSQMWLMLLYHLVAVHALSWAPFWGWLLLVSAWARRAPFLWATLPLLAIGLVEKIALNTTHFAALLGYRFMGGPESTTSTANPMSMAALTPTPVQFLTSASFWMGLVVAAAFLAAAARMRRYRDPI
jgi:ABC-2 type transport system permease protein